MAPINLKALVAEKMEQARAAYRGPGAPKGKKHRPHRPRLKDQIARQQRQREYRREYFKQYSPLLRRATLQALNAIKAALTCSWCNEDHPACLEFHHRDPSTKRDTVANIARRGTLSDLQVEIEKCDVLCSNCHRKKHWFDHVMGEETERLPD